MKINKILAAGMAATLAVTSLSAVVSAETVTKSFDMATSVGTLTIKQEGALGVDYLASIVGDETYRSPMIVAPAKDGTITIDLSNAVFYAPYNKGANTLKIANGDFDITGVKLVVTGIQGGKNNTSKDYEYAFKEDGSTDKFTLAVNVSEGKGFIPTQFVEITKVKYVFEAKFSTQVKEVYESAKDGSDGTWGGTLENYTVTTDLNTDGSEKAALYTVYQAALKDQETAQKAYDALLALYNGQSKQLSDAEIEAAKAELIKLVGANWEKLVGINDSKLDSNADLAGTLKTLITKMNGVEAGTSKIAATDTDLKGTAYETAVNAYFAYYKEDLTLPDAQPETAEAAAEAGVKTLANWIVEFNRQIATIQSDIEVANNNIADAKARMEQAREALKQADPAITFDENGKANDGKNDLDGSANSAGGADKTVVRDYVDANATYQQYRTTIAEGPSKIAELEGKLNKVAEKQTALKENIAFERNIILKTYYQLKKVLEERAGATKVSVTDEELAAALKKLNDAKTATATAKSNWEKAPAAEKSDTDTILGTIANVKKIMDGWDATHFWVGYNDKSVESRFAPLPRTTTNTTIGRTDVKVLSYTGAHGSDNIWSDGYTDYANQSYSGDDVTKGTAPRQFAGLASQAADFFNKRNNGKITFKFTAAANTSSGWVNGGVPSTEVGLKSSLAGSNFGMFWNYSSSTGQLISLGQVDDDALTVTFDISQILDDMGGLTKGNLNDIFYGLNKGITYGSPYNFTGYLVEQVIFSYDDAASETDADVETVDEDDDTDTETDTETVVDEDDDDDDDDDYIVDEDDDDDAAAIVDEDDDDDDDAPAVIVSDDKDDTDTNNDVVIVTPVKEDDDANPGTGVGLAVIPAIVAAAAMVVSKKRK